LGVAGSFNLAGDQYASNFAIYNLNSKSWNNAYGGVYGSINSVVSIGDYIYVGGSFTSVGQNTLANNVAAYNVKTGQWSTLNRGVDGTVYKLLNYGGSLLAVGAFISGSGQTLNYVGLWSNSRWSHLSFPSKNSSSCTQNFCSVDQLGANGVYDAAVVGGDLYVVSSSAYSSEIFKYRGSHGWVNVDGGNAINGFNNGAASGTGGFVRGGQYIAPGTGSNEVDFWNFYYSSAYPSQNVVTYNTNQANWQDNKLKGVNGQVNFVAPQTTGDVSSAFVLASSFSLIVAIAFALLML